MQILPEIKSLNLYAHTFQGQEKDDEIKGKGNAISYKYRVHDPRIGRFFSVDPLTSKYPYNSPYAFSENRVIDGVELEGLEFKASTTENEKGETVFKIDVTITVWNSSKKSTFSSEDMTGIEEKISNQVKKTYDLNGTTNIEFEVHLIQAESKEDFDVADFKMEYKDAVYNTLKQNYTLGKTDVIGNTQENHFWVALTKAGANLAEETIIRTAVHEIGHTAGLRHPYDKNADKKIREQYLNGEVFDNIMIQDSKVDPSMTPQDALNATEDQKKQMLNQTIDDMFDLDSGSSDAETPKKTQGDE